MELQGQTRNERPARRGILPTLLLKQVQNTAPFLFLEEKYKEKRFGYLSTLQDFHDFPRDELPIDEYFRLCLSAHYATVATFVPTDVDNTIRMKLWAQTGKDNHEKMGRIVLDALQWDVEPVSVRYVHSPVSHKRISGHQGEWYSVAVAAYAACPKKNEDVAVEILNSLKREIEGLQEIIDARDGIQLLKASVLMAHNLGDLDRVVEAWNLADDDFLKKQAYKLGHELNSHIDNSVLVLAGNINKKYMADENHRHFYLRVPRSLRKSRDLLLPMGPFFYDWGKIVGKHPQLQLTDVAEIAEALIAGWMKLPHTVGYSRALAGIIDSFPGGLDGVVNLLPARYGRVLQKGQLRSLCAVSESRFLETWAAFGLKSILSH